MNASWGRRFLPILSCTLLLFGVGCATILHGPNQSVEVVTAPEGARASALGRTVTTPGVLRLPRKAEHVEIRIDKEGFEPRIVRLERTTSGAVWWNFVEVPVGVVSGGAAGAAMTSGEGWFSGLTGAVYGGAAAGAGLTGIGFAIDYANGAAYRLTPTRVVVRLEPIAVEPTGTFGRDRR